MSSYEDIAKHLWNFSATYCCREEDIWDQTLLTIGGGYEWENGELVHFRHEKPKNNPESIADAAKDMVKGDNDKDPSFWFDHYYIEFLARKNLTKYFKNIHVSKGYGNISNIPDDITKEWASVILSTCLWIDTYELDEYIKIHLDDKVKMYFGCGEEQEKRIYDEHPEWKAIKDKHFAITKNMDLMDAIFYEDEEYDKVHALVMNLMVKENTPKAKDYLKTQFQELKDAAVYARKRLSDLGLGDVESYKVPVREKNISIPKWYKPNSKRKENDCFFWTSDENKMDDISDKFNCYGVYMTIRELKSLLPKEAYAKN
jgi:hypothetical protein